jgi:hypothetical protein
MVHIVNSGPRKQVFFQFPTIPADSPGKDYNSISTIPPLSTSTIEVIFPRPGLYVEMDSDLCHFMKGSGFAVRPVDNSREDDHPKRSRVIEELPPASGEHGKNRLLLTVERRKVPVVPDNDRLPGGYIYNAIVLVGRIFPTNKIQIVGPCRH